MKLDNQYLFKLKDRSVKFKNQTHLWSGPDNQISFDRLDKSSTLYNYYLENSFTYRYNNYGYRSDDDYYEGDEGSIFLGCSFTEGIGLDLNNTWAYKLHKHLGGKFFSLAKGGTGSDTWFRYLFMFLPILKVNNVFLLGTDWPRFEFFDNSEVMTTSVNLPMKGFQNKYPNFTKDILSNTYLSGYNFYKNLLSIKQLCYSKNINFFFIDINSDDKYIKEISEKHSDSHLGIARDNMHPGILYQDHIYSKFLDLL